MTNVDASGEISERHFPSRAIWNETPTLNRAAQATSKAHTRCPSAALRRFVGRP